MNPKLNSQLWTIVAVALVVRKKTEQLSPSEVNELPDGRIDRSTRDKLLINHPAHLSKQPKS